MAERAAESGDWHLHDIDLDAIAAGHLPHGRYASQPPGHGYWEAGDYDGYENQNWRASSYDGNPYGLGWSHGAGGERL
jgi:hypothetical protein